MNKPLYQQGQKYFIKMNENGTPVINSMVIAPKKPAGNWKDITNVINTCCNPNNLLRYALTVQMTTGAITGLSVTAITVNGAGVSGPGVLPVPFSATRVLPTTAFQVLTVKGWSTVAITYTSTAAATLTLTDQAGTVQTAAMPIATGGVVSISNVYTGNATIPMSTPSVTLAIA